MSDWLILLGGTILAMLILSLVFGLVLRNRKGAGCMLCGHTDTLGCHEKNCPEKSH